MKKSELKNVIRECIKEAASHRAHLTPHVMETLGSAIYDGLSSVEDGTLDLLADDLEGDKDTAKKIWKEFYNKVDKAASIIAKQTAKKYV